MVAARVQFLGAGHYAAIAAAAAASLGHQGGPILEIGAGTGYYLAAALDRTGASGIALDSSKYAARRAATDHRVISVVADAWSALPIRDSSVGSVLSVFAPRNPDEIVRVLRPGGGFVGVTPQAHHLLELRERLTMLTVDEGKASRLADAFVGRLDRVGRTIGRIRDGAAARRCGGAGTDGAECPAPDPGSAGRTDSRTAGATDRDRSGDGQFVPVGQRARRESRSASRMTTLLPSRRNQPRWSKSASALLTVSREAPTSWASSSCVRSWVTRR